MITQLDTENADLDIKTAFICCLTDTPDASFPMMCQALLLLGDGAKDLDGTGGDFKIKVNLGLQESHELSFTVTSGDVRAALWTPEFPVPADTEVKVYVFSPNGDDAEVDVTAYLFDCSPISYVPAESTGVETTLEGMMKQLWRRFFKRATQTATELKTYRNDDDTVVTVQDLSDDDTTQIQGAASL